MSLDTFNKLMEITKKRGLREGFRFLRGRINSTKRFHVFRHSLENIPDYKLKSDKYSLVEVEDIESDLFKEIFPVWPSDDTKPNDSEYVTAMLRDRSKTGAMCFVLVYENHVVGGTWFFRPNDYYLHFKIPYQPGDYISTWTFIVPKHRGIGGSKYMKTRCLRIAKERGIPSMISISSMDNIPSVKMNFGVGYKEIGKLTEKYRWFKYSQVFEKSEGTV